MSLVEKEQDITSPKILGNISEFNDSESGDRFIKEYIEEWTQEDLDLAEYIAEQITTVEDLPATIVIIPVAAHVEAQNIVPALAEYAKQDTSKKFAVHLHLNWPTSYEGFQDIDEAYAEIARAKELFPDLDIRVSQMYYDEPKIGGIRRAAWNGTLLKLYSQGNHEQAVGMNHDIDIVKLSRNYVGNVQKFYKEYYEQETFALAPPSASTQIKHAFEPDYPNTSMAVFWKDISSRLSQNSYEAGLVVPMATYALRDGFSKDSATHETSRFYNNFGPTPLIPGTSLTTSLRRYLDRLPDNDFDTIWTPDSFSADDDCRVKKEFKDISHEELIRKVTEDATYFGINYVDMAFDWHVTELEERNIVDDDADVRESAKKVLFARVKKTERIMRYVLDQVLEIPRVGEFNSAQYFSEDYLNHIIYVKRMKFERRQFLLSKRARDEWFAEFIQKYEDQ